jgi:hypothetical protein
MFQEYPRFTAFWKHQDRLVLKRERKRSCRVTDILQTNVAMRPDPSVPLRCEDSPANGVLLDGGEARAAL